MSAGIRQFALAVLLCGASAAVAATAPGAAAAPAALPTVGGATPPPGWKEPVLGPLAIEPVTGNLETPIKVTSGGGCPGGTSSITRIWGPGFPDIGENVIGNSEVNEFGNPSMNRMVAPLTITIKEALDKQPTGTVLDGEYLFTMGCQEAMPADYDELYGYYLGKLTITPDGKYTALTTAEDLPDPPTPETGAAARALGERSQVDPETAAIAARQAAEADLARANAEDGISEESNGGESRTVPLLVAGGILALALTAAGFAGSKRPARSKVGSNK